MIYFQFKDLVHIRVNKRQNVFLNISLLLRAIFTAKCLSFLVPFTISIMYLFNVQPKIYARFRRFLEYLTWKDLPIFPKTGTNCFYTTRWCTIRTMFSDVQQDISFIYSKFARIRSLFPKLFHVPEVLP